MMRSGAALAALALIAAPGAAQDIPSPYDGAVAEFGQRQLESTLARRQIEQAQASRKSSGSLDARRRASCAALPRYRASSRSTGAAIPACRS